MPKIMKNGLVYSGVPDETVTAWETQDVQDIDEPTMGDTDISGIGDGSITGAIGALNGSLNILSPRKATNGSGISGDFYYYRIGNVCVGCGTMTATSDISAYTEIIKNLPKTYDGSAYMGAFVTADQAYNQFYVANYGITTRQAISSGTLVRLSCVYMCE